MLAKEIEFSSSLIPLTEIELLERLGCAVCKTYIQTYATVLDYKKLLWQETTIYPDCLCVYRLDIFVLIDCIQTSTSA